MNAVVVPLRGYICPEHVRAEGGDLGHQIHLRSHPRRDHVAQEYQDRGLPEIAAGLGRALKAPLRRAAGVPELDIFNRRYVPVFGEAVAA